MFVCDVQRTKRPGCYPIVLTLYVACLPALASIPAFGAGSTYVSIGFLKQDLINLISAYAICPFPRANPKRKPHQKSWLSMRLEFSTIACSLESLTKKAALGGTRFPKGEMSR